MAPLASSRTTNGSMCPASRPASACAMYVSVCCGSGPDANPRPPSQPSAAALASASRCSRASGSRRTPWPSSVTGRGSFIWRRVYNGAPMDKDRPRQAVEQVFRDMAGAMTAGMAFVGTRTGLFRAMAGKGALTVEDVVRASKLERRYVEEWLRGMVSAGYVEYHAAKETYTLPDEMAYFVASEGTDHFVGGMWEMVPALMRVAPRVAEAFEKGGGVPFADFGPDCVNALDLINRGQYESRFADYWLKGLPDVVARLKSGGPPLQYCVVPRRLWLAPQRALPQTPLRRHRPP